MGARKTSSEDSEILGEDVDHSPVDRAPAGDHAIARHLLLGHAELDGPVLDEHVELLEGALVEEQVDAFAGGELALAVLGGDALVAPALAGGFAAGFELVEDVLHGKPWRGRRVRQA